MKILKENRTVRQEVEIYQAFDGKKFDKREECEEYEEKAQKLKTRLHKMRIDELEGMMPCDGDEHYESSDYSWYKVNNADEVEFLNDYYNLSYTYTIKESDAPDIICIEKGSDDDNWAYPLKKSREYVKSLFEGLNIQVTFSDEA